MNIAKLLPGIALVLATAGCNESTPETTEGTEAGGIVTIGGSTTSQTAAESTGAESSGDSSSSEGGFVEDLECEFIDFVFVVDNSLSMADEQQNLVAAVPGFVESIQTQLPDVENIRVGVVDTDTYPGLGNPDPLNACPDDAACDACDYQLGALLTKPASGADLDASCEFGTGMPYMDGMSDAFASEFECAAVVGTEGNPIEQQASALVEAVSQPMNEAGSCNDTFVRDDALLVFLIISDEEDDVSDPPKPQGGSMGDPDQWFDAIVEAKGGVAKNTVALGLLGGSPRFGDCEALSAGLDGAEQTTRLTRFIEKFPTHFTGSVCSQSYSEFFREALDAVAVGCEKFVPAG